MKVIMYMSQVVDTAATSWLPADLEAILRTARTQNRAHAITGVFSCKKGHYLQIIEGPDRQVDQLFANLKQDSRHAGMLKIREVQTQQRYFDNWDMKLISFCEVDAQFVQFMKDHVVGKITLPVEKQAAFSRFYNLQFGTRARPSIGDHQDHEYRLKRWPNFIDLEPSQTLMGLCGLLTGGGWLDCDELLADCDYDHAEDLYQALDELNAQNVLEARSLRSVEMSTRRRVATQAQVQTSTVQVNQSGLSFYQRMKQFLRARRTT